MKGTLSITDASGHTEVKWDTEAPETVEETRRQFDEIVSRGYLAYAKTDTGSEQIRSFDPEAEEIVVTAPLVGG